MAPKSGLLIEENFTEMDRRPSLLIADQPSKKNSRREIVKDKRIIKNRRVKIVPIGSVYDIFAYMYHKM